MVIVAIDDFMFSAATRRGCPRTRPIDPAHRSTADQSLLSRMIVICMHRYAVRNVHKGTS